jgi:hypothetical protein
LRADLTHPNPSLLRKEGSEENNLINPLCGAERVINPLYSGDDRVSQLANLLEFNTYQK